MDLGESSTRIALVQYDHRFNIEFDFLDDSTQVFSSFENINQLRGGTKTGAAITFAYENIILKSARPGVQVKMVVVTDGQSFDDVQVISDEMRERDIEMIAVGFGSYNLNELQQIANDPDEEYLFTGSSAEDLKDLLEDVTKIVCKTDGASTRSKGNFTPINNEVLDFIKNSYVEQPEIVDQNEERLQ